MTRHCRLPLLAIAVFVGFTAYLAAAAQAASCGERDNIIAQLDSEYGETRRGIGLSGGVILEIWASDTTGTFTILSTTPNGFACVIAAGEDWIDLGAVLAGEAL